MNIALSPYPIQPLVKILPALEVVTELISPGLLSVCCVVHTSSPLLEYFVSDKPLEIYIEPLSLIVNLPGSGTSIIHSSSPSLVYFDR